MLTSYLVICSKEYFIFWLDDKKPEIEKCDLHEIFQKIPIRFNGPFLYSKLDLTAFLYLEISSKDFFESLHDGEAPKYKDMSFN